MSDTFVGVVVVCVILAAIVGVIALGMWGLPTYNVWCSGLSGQAKLQRAEQEKQILIETAKAEAEAARLQAAAIAIVGNAAKQYPEYRQQQFIQAFGEAIQSGAVEQIIYVPTEANIPIVEARR